MRAAVYYFTGSGNSLVAARGLAEGLGSDPPEPIAQLVQKHEVAPSEDAVGLVYPAHHWGPPDIVLRFARHLRPLANAYVFAVATYGGRPGRPFSPLHKALRKWGHGLDAGFHVKTVQNYVPVFAIPHESVQTVLQEGAGRKVDQIAAAVIQRADGEPERWRRRPFVRAYYLSSKRNLHYKDRWFTVSGGCSSCGVCEKVCPVRNIVMREKTPHWLHRCEQCFACLHWCPESAIEWGGATRGMGRYHHPDVTVEDMMEQAGRHVEGPTSSSE
jgi:ferredoxin